MWGNAGEETTPLRGMKQDFQDYRISRIREEGWGGGIRVYRNTPFAPLGLGSVSMTVGYTPFAPLVLKICQNRGRH